MPSNSPEVKKSAVRNYGGEIIECVPTLAGRESTTKKLIEEKGLTFVNPFNDINVVMGHASAGKELLTEYPGLDSIVVPVGGGGLISGIALSANVFGKNCSAIGAEPFNVYDAYHSLIACKIVPNKPNANTIADGLKTTLGDITFNKENKIQKIKAKQHYTKFTFLPSPDGSIYDWGFGALLGPINHTVNTTINQLLNAGTIAT